MKNDVTIWGFRCEPMRDEGDIESEGMFLFHFT